MFLSAAIAMIFTQLVSVIATIIDGIITSRYLGETAYSAISLFGPFTGILFMIVIFFSTGCQVVCSILIGKGKKETANHVFSAAAVAVFCFSILLILIGGFFADDLISLYGISLKEKPEIFLYLKDYLHGYMIGIPAIMLSQIMGPMCVMDGAKRRFIFSAATLCIADVIGDLLNVFVFHGGVFGMGAATSIALVAQFLILAPHFFTGKGILKFSVHKFRDALLKDLAKNGSPAFAQYMATVVRDFLINKINLMFAVSAVAIAAKGVQNDLNVLMFCVGLGIGKTLLAMTGVYYGANDRSGLRKLLAAAIKHTFVISTTVCIILIAGAELIADFYSDDPEAIMLEIFAIRCMALSLVFDAVLIAYQNYLQGIRNTKAVTFMNFADRLFVPVLTAFILGHLFGTKGIMASIATGKVILALAMFGIICFKAKRFPRSEKDFMLLPKDFGIPDENTKEGQISDMTDVTRESIEAEQFCIDHGINETKAKLISLFVEELGSNIIKYGKPIRGKKILAEYRLFTDGTKIGICFRDFCKPFDPVMYAKSHAETDPGEHIGLKMVMNLAKDAKYYNTFNTNNVMLFLDN